MKGLTLILVVAFLIVLLVIVSKIQTLRESFESETETDGEDSYFEKVITDGQKLDEYNRKVLNKLGTH